MSYKLTKNGKDYKNWDNFKKLLKNHFNSNKLNKIINALIL